MKNILVIGNGPAGISASIYAKRSNINVINISKIESPLFKTPKIDNYYGFENGIGGKELYLKGIEQAKNLGVEFFEEEVLSVEQQENGFSVKTTNGTFESNAIILALGSSTKKPNIENLSKFEGRGVSYCAICDGFFFRNKKIAVLGSGNYAFSEYKVLKNMTKDITILTDGEKTTFENKDKNVKIIENKIQSLEGERTLKTIKFDNFEENFDGVFVAYGQAGAIELAKKLGIGIENNLIAVNENMQTNISNVYACGDCVKGFKQVAKAVYEGMLAGLSAVKNLHN